MDEPAFRIRIVEQRWAAVPDDFRSVGRIDLVIGGQQILTNADGEFGIGEAALALLRTLEFDYDPEEEQWKQVLHGCGLTPMIGCPIGADWRVRHDDDIVVISDVVRFPTKWEADQVSFGDLTVKVLFSDYEREVTAFARNARSMFGDAPLTRHRYVSFLNMDGDSVPLSRFLQEYDHRLAQYTVEPN